MATVEKTIDINVPLGTAYNQYTQFESFPQFMEGVESVQQLDDKRLHWVAEIAGQKREWDAEITEQIPDQVIAWRSLSGKMNNGRVTFMAVDPTACRVTVLVEYDPQGLVETIGDKLGFVDGRVEGDLERFKEFVEKRGPATPQSGDPGLTGAWRGEVHSGEVTK